MNYLLFDDSSIRESLLPLTYLRPVSGIRVGVFTIKEKWENCLGSISDLTQGYLSGHFPSIIEKENVVINGALCPDDEILREIQGLAPGKGIKKGGCLLAFRGDSDQLKNFQGSDIEGDCTEIDYEVVLIDKIWKIFQYNGEQLRRDISFLAENNTFQKITDKHSSLYGKDNIFVGENVNIKSAVIDAENGPVYLADNSVVSPGAIIKGSFALLESSEINMGGRMRGDITIGPKCKVGGEISNSIFFGYSNKAHDGFVGNSVIAEWCNLGADTNTSNMKNDYSDVKLWNYGSGRFESSQSTFCGLVMGDHSKTGINVMLNSGTSIGISSSVYNANYPRNFIPSFVKGGASGWTTMRINEAVTVAQRMMARRKKEFTGVDQQLFEKVFELSTSYRRS